MSQHYLVLIKCFCYCIASKSDMKWLRYSRRWEKDYYFCEYRLHTKFLLLRLCISIFGDKTNQDFVLSVNLLIRSFLIRSLTQYDTEDKVLFSPCLQKYKSKWHLSKLNLVFCLWMWVRLCINVCLLVYISIVLYDYCNILMVPWGGNRYTETEVRYSADSGGIVHKLCVIPLI